MRLELCLQRQDMRNKEVCVNVSVWMCDVTGQLCIMTHKDPILTHEDRHTHTHTVDEACRCHSYCHRADPLVGGHMSALCRGQCRSFTAADVP